MGVGGQPHAPAASIPGKDPVPIVQEAGWAPGPVWTGGKSRPHRDFISDRPVRSLVAIPTELPGPNKTYFTCEVTLYVAQTVNTEQLQHSIP